jgi:chromosome segregation ATPase
MYTTAVQQLTTLRGVLQIADKQLARDRETARLTSDIADIIRGSNKLQNQVRSMVKYQVAALQQIDDRLRNGIFDPDKDIADLEEYLIYSMGRNSKQTIQLAIRTAQADAQLNKWKTERQDVAFRLAEAQERLASLKARLDRAQHNPDPLMIDHLNNSIQETEARIDVLQKNLAELDENIQQRMNLLGVRLSEMENFGYQIESTKLMWDELNKTKDEMAKAFDAAILQRPTP